MIVVPSGAAALHRVRGDAADRAGPVLDDHRQAETVLHLVGDHARDQVGGAAGREADEDLHRLVELVLRRCRRGDDGKRRADSAGRGGERTERSVMDPPGEWWRPARRLGAGSASIREAALRSRVVTTGTTDRCGRACAAAPPRRCRARCGSGARTGARPCAPRQACGIVERRAAGHRRDLRLARALEVVHEVERVGDASRRRSGGRDCAGSSRRARRGRARAARCSSESSATPS